MVPKQVYTKNVPFQDRCSCHSVSYGIVGLFPTELEAFIDGMRLGKHNLSRVGVWFSTENHLTTVT